ncbi:DAK2 domain-containing protein [Peptococcaceae bacterium 1198_IL3148]
MGIYTMDGIGFKLMLTGSANLLAKQKHEIDALNVFPVPDGDTGTNMYLTLLEAAKEAQQVEGDHLGEVAEAAARGCLMGARGNSGVILSQVVRGFSNALKDKPAANANDIAMAIAEGAKLAYHAVSNPVEGTVLTVLRKSAEAAQQAADRSPELFRFMVATLRQALKALDETPNQLPILKEAGVVDAGGKGWVTIWQGMLYSLRQAEHIELLHDFTSNQEKRLAEFNVQDIEDDINFTYCTEFLLKGNLLPLAEIKNQLKPYGDCLMVVGSEEVAKVHIHSNHPGLVIETCLNYGSLHKLNISNMREQNEGLREEPQHKHLAVVAVSIGEGIDNILESLGVDVIVRGGQTMNPSTDDILKAVEAAPADSVIVLPNNKNIIMAANQAAAISKKEVAVIPTLSIPQGIAALLALDPEASISENVEAMTDGRELVRTGEITTAVRNVSVQGQAINQGDIIGLLDDKIVTSGKKMDDVLRQLMQALTANDEELITIYYGDDVTGEAAQQTADKLQQEFPHLEIEVHYGGQPLYQYLISAE